MGYIIEITEDKVDKMSEYVEDMLWAGGELMHCIEKMKGEQYGYGHRESSGRYGMGERTNYRGGSYGNRKSGGRMNYRDDEDWEEMEEMDERRGRRRDSRGRYM